MSIFIRIKKFFFKIKYGIENLCFYFKVIIQDRPYTYIFILRLLDKKLEQIEKYRKAHKHQPYEKDEELLLYIQQVRKEIHLFEDSGYIDFLKHKYNLRFYAEAEQMQINVIFDKLKRIFLDIWD